MPQRVTRQIETITPDRARQLLTLNRHNKPVDWAKVHKYAAAMRAGRWDPLKGSIKVYRDELIVDGQHRLYAVIEAGIPVKMRVKQRAAYPAYLRKGAQ
ncbi:MAG: hypothetical protein WD533_06450 [Dehalococcoidia bacterium]